MTQQTAQAKAEAIRVANIAVKDAKDGNQGQKDAAAAQLARANALPD